MNKYLLLFSLACNPDVLIHNDYISVGVANPPDLALPTQVDTIHQLSIPEVDILFCIDNSGSMGDEQEKLRAGFNTFANHITSSNIDYHIGVITTDMDSNRFSGKLQSVGNNDERFIHTATNDVVAAFYSLADVGINGSGTEKGSAAIYAALTDPLASHYNYGFRREHAPLHVIVVSDEDDGTLDPSSNEFINFMRLQEATYSGIIGGRNGCPGASPSFRYQFAIESIGGATESICDADWTDMMDRLGIIASQLRQEFFLSHIPVVDTIEVQVAFDDYVYTDLSFIYNGDRNSIYLDMIAPALSEVVITYTLLE